MACMLAGSTTTGMGQPRDAIETLGQRHANLQCGGRMMRIVVVDIEVPPPHTMPHEGLPGYRPEDPVVATPVHQRADPGATGRLEHRR